ncbi:E3 ubiquitin-protein ligase IPI1-like [Aristolochia californica]|uniref:E3 ubiquitin-protein ligase IPI1-like n=1 Tax=Aristolochia californica TaxID=171875 RepID=UPI0035D56515
MGLGKTNLCDDRGGDVVSVVASTVSCSICLDSVTDNGDRSTAKLQCGHEFHLDCIGSAFNAKGSMQCPNCRKIEKGQWLYANGYRSFPEFSIDDWTHDEDLYDLSYSDMPLGVHWCPFSGLTRLPSSFEEGESPPTSYQDLFGPHPLFGDHAAPSSAAHSCPYVAYFQPLQPSSSSNSAESATDGPNFHHQWSSVTGPGDVPTSHSFPAVDIHYHGWDHHSPFSPPNSRINGADQASISSTTLRPTRPESDGLPRTGSFIHPFLRGHGSTSRAGSSVISILPPYLGNARGHPRVQNSRAYPQQQGSLGIRPLVFSGARRSNGPRGVASVSAHSSSDHSGYYVLPPSGLSGRSIPESENPAGSGFYAWERDRFAPYPLVPVDRESSWWGPFHQGASGSDSSSRNGFWHGHASERLSSQARTQNSSYQPIHLSQMHPYL